MAFLDDNPAYLSTDLLFEFKQAILMSLDTFEHAVSVVVQYQDRDVMDAFWIAWSMAGNMKRLTDCRCITSKGEGVKS